MSRIPQNATKDVQQGFIEVWEKLDKLTSRNIDLNGRRIINAGRSLNSNDYVIRQELISGATASTPSTGSAAVSINAEAGAGKLMRLDGTEMLIGERDVTADWIISGAWTITGTMTFSAAPTINANPVINGTPEIRGATPTLTFTDTDSGHDDFNIYVENDQLLFRRATTVQFGLDAAGELQCLQVGSSSDLGGTAGITSLTNDTAIPSAAYAWGGGNGPNAYLKLYFGETTIAVPYWNV